MKFCLAGSVGQCLHLIAQPVLLNLPFVFMLLQLLVGCCLECRVNRRLGCGFSGGFECLLVCVVGRFWLLWIIGDRVFRRFCLAWQPSDNQAMWRVQALMSLGVLVVVVASVTAAAFGNVFGLLWAHAAVQSAWVPWLAGVYLLLFLLAERRFLSSLCDGIGRCEVVGADGGFIGTMGGDGSFCLGCFDREHAWHCACCARRRPRIPLVRFSLLPVLLSPCGATILE